MTDDTAASSLTRLRLPANLIHRWRLLDRLQAGLDLKLTLISAPIGFRKTTLISDPVDQAGLIGMISQVNMLGLPLVSVECASAPEANTPSFGEDA